MTNQHLKQLIIEQYPTGFSFEPNALRLVEGKIGYAPNDIDLAKIKQEMFQRQDGLYLFCEQVADEETREEIKNTAEEWISEFGCFALEALQKKYEQKIKNVSNIEDFGVFLEKLHFPLEAYQNVWYDQNKKIRITRPVAFAKLTQCVKKIIDEEYSAPDYEIFARIPALNSELLVAVVKDKMPQVIRTENNGTMCFQFAENYLPDDLSEKIREAIKKIEEINMQVTPETLHLMLSSIYQTNFNKTYSIPDMREFNRIIRQYYEGDVSRKPQYRESKKLQFPKTIPQTMSYSKPSKPSIPQIIRTLWEQNKEADGSGLINLNDLKTTIAENNLPFGSAFTLQITHLKRAWRYGILTSTIDVKAETWGISETVVDNEGQKWFRAHNLNQQTAFVHANQNMRYPDDKKTYKK